MQNNIPWIEKYRPCRFDDIVLDPMNRVFFRNILSRKYFPNLMFYGPPGTGKTTTIINLINEYQAITNPHNVSLGKNKEGIIHLNASDERGIDIIRNQINQFVKSNHLFEPGLKFVILDEVDYMTKNAQQALKSLLQMCRPNVRFCLICNYISKIDESLQNEFICVRFNQLPKNEIYKFIRNITETEGVSITPGEIESIQTNYYSDIRSMINFIQLNSASSEQTERKELKIVCSDNWDKIHGLLRQSTLLSGNGRHCVASVLGDVELYIHELSIQYNIDKRNILNSYFNYVIRTYPEIIVPGFLSIVENVVHTTDDVPIKSVLAYFCSNLANHYQTTACHTITSVR